MDFIGALIGSFVGLLALLLAALYNAKLTRDRDEKIRQEESKSIAAAMFADFDSALSALDNVKTFIESAPVNSLPEQYDFAERLAVPDLIRRQSLSYDTARLPFEVALKVTYAVRAYDLICSLCRLMAGEMARGEFSQCRGRVVQIQSLASSIGDAMEGLAPLGGVDDRLTACKSDPFRSYAFTG